MAENVNEEISMEEYNNLKKELKQVESELNQYKNALKEQTERYNTLFGLFANNVDYMIANTKRKEGK